MEDCVNCPDLCLSPYDTVQPKCFKPGCQKQITFERKVFDLVNAVRKRAGLRPLLTDRLLITAARDKAKDMALNDYFSHDSPTYGSPLNMLKSFGIASSLVGENIASGFPGPVAVFKEWMKSPGHRTNILKPEYTHLGVGYFFSEKGNYKHYWVQEFICPP